MENTVEAQIEQYKARREAWRAIKRSIQILQKDVEKEREIDKSGLIETLTPDQKLDSNLVKSMSYVDKHLDNLNNKIKYLMYK